MNFFRNRKGFLNKEGGKNHRIRRIVFIFLAILIVFIVGFLVKAGSVVQKVTQGNVFESIVRSLPGVPDTLKGEKDGRINVLLLGMRGAGVEGGGLLADTIIVVSVFPEKNAVSMVSVPRDLYVTIPGTNEQRKINYAHYAGEENGKGEGLETMKQAIANVTGLEIHYAASIDFAGFKELVDSIGGLDLHLDEPFIEPVQFHEEKVCDEHVFTVPSGNYEIKKSGRTGKIKAQYPLCYNPVEECGGIFEVPAGDVHLDGENTLCYVRSRATSSDFDRAKRQREVMDQIKKKATSVGTLSDFSKINAMFDALGDNVRTDMAAWEMKAFWDLEQKMVDYTRSDRGLDNSEEGLLYNPEQTPETGYILLPRGDNYDKIHEMFNNLP